MKKIDFFYRKTMLTAFVVAIVLFALPLIVQAQGEPTLFAVVDLMKVNQGDDQKYLDLEENFWKPVHQERVNQGEIIAWELYKVRYTGTDDEYNYVTVAIFADPAKLEYPFQVDPAKIHPDADVDKMYSETMASRQLVKKILFLRVDGIESEEGRNTKYLQVNFMKVKPGMEGAYVDNETKVWKPVHQEFVNDSTRSGWSVWQELYPSGAGLDFQYVTVDNYSDFTQLGAADFQGAFKKAHADADVDELMKETGNVRTLVKSELWELLDMVSKQ